MPTHNISAHKRRRQGLKVLVFGLFAVLIAIAIFGMRAALE